MDNSKQKLKKPLILKSFKFKYLLVRRKKNENENRKNAQGIKYQYKKKLIKPTKFEWRRKKPNCYLNNFKNKTFR